MAALTVFRLMPCGAFHFGSAGVGLEQTGVQCPSDTLYSALFAESLLAGRAFGATRAGEGQPDLPFRISSCLPYAGRALLFPRPRLASRQAEEAQRGTRKRIKNLQYVSATILRHLLAGGSLQDYLRGGTGAETAHLYQDGAALVAAADGPAIANDTIWSTDRIDRVTVDRQRDAGQYFAVGQVRFAEACGLFVLAQTRDAAATAALHELLVRLGHSGLGGRRSSGLGQFDVAEPETIDLPDTTGQARAMLLSRYLPSLPELEAGVLGRGASYDLVQVGGWLASNNPEVVAQRRRAIHLLTEGSIVNCPNGQPPLGAVADVAPDVPPFAHPVWRYGLALTIGVTAKEGV